MLELFILTLPITMVTAALNWKNLSMWWYLRRFS